MECQAHLEVRGVCSVDAMGGERVEALVYVSLLLVGAGDAAGAVVRVEAIGDKPGTPGRRWRSGRKSGVGLSQVCHNNCISVGVVMLVAMLVTVVSLVTMGAAVASRANGWVTWVF